MKKIVNFKKIKIVRLVCTLLSFLVLSCNEKEVQKHQNLKEKEKNESHKISILNENLKKRFSKVYKEKNIVFNNSSTVDITKPLHFDKPVKPVSNTFFVGDNIQPIEELNTDSLGVVIQDGEYHPTTIGKVALKAINYYKGTKSEAAKKVFLDQVRWAENNFYETENYGFWYFSVPAPLYHLDSGWTSAFSQGLLLNVFLEAYYLTEEDKYAKIIEKALKAYLVPVEYGGFTRTWGGNEMWYEEYSTARPSRVLNGTIYGLEGVYNVYKSLDSDLAKKIFEEGVNTIKNHLEKYDAKYTSRYSLADWKNEVSQEHYHEEHVIQLLWLYEITGDSVFKKYAKIFLENDLGDFMITSIFKLKDHKIMDIKASHCIDCEKHGRGSLTDEIWAYGNFWSSHKQAELTIDFGEKKQNISSLTLYHVSSQSKDVNFKLYAYNDQHDTWDFKQLFIPKMIKDRVAAYNLTGKYETFIEHYKIFEEINTQKIKLVFEANNDSIIAIREINFIYDRSNELDYEIKKVKELANRSFNK